MLPLIDSGHPAPERACTHAGSVASSADAFKAKARVEENRTR